MLDEAVAHSSAQIPPACVGGHRTPAMGYDLEERAAGAENFVRLRNGVTAARGFSGWNKRPALPRFQRIDWW